MHEASGAILPSWDPLQRVIFPTPLRRLVILLTSRDPKRGPSPKEQTHCSTRCEQLSNKSNVAYGPSRNSEANFDKKMRHRMREKHEALAVLDPLLSLLTLDPRPSWLVRGTIGSPKEAQSRLKSAPCPAVLAQRPQP